MVIGGTPTTQNNKKKKEKQDKKDNSKNYFIHIFEIDVFTSISFFILLSVIYHFVVYNYIKNI